MGHFATIYDVTTVQLSNGTLHKFHKIVLFSKMHLHSTLKPQDSFGKKDTTFS